MDLLRDDPLVKFSYDDINCRLKNPSLRRRGQNCFLMGRP